RVQQLLEATAARLATRELHPLQRRAYPLGEAIAAFRWMQKGNHVGKIVLSVANPTIRKNAAYLITGGLGGLGRLETEWLAELGAGSIVLLGRRNPSAADQHWIRQVEARYGCAVHAVSGDVSDAKTVTVLLSRFGTEFPPLKGIIHSAGVLDDGVLSEQ